MAAAKISHGIRAGFGTTDTKASSSCGTSPPFGGLFLNLPLCLELVMDKGSDLLIERAARATWLIENRLPSGRLRPLSAWRDLAPSIRERERARIIAANEQLKLALACLGSAR
jgi:hypothetical protein